MWILYNHAPRGAEGIPGYWQFAQKTGANFVQHFFQKSIDKRRDKVYNKGVKTRAPGATGAERGKNETT